MARTLLECGDYQLAQQVSHRALEAAAVADGGESAKEASARQQGVSLARNVLANASDELAKQSWAEAQTLNEAFERRMPQVSVAAEAAKTSAMDTAGAVDAQLGDPVLLSKATEDELRKLEVKRAQSTALLEHAMDLIRSLKREEKERLSTVQAAERAVDEAEAAHEQQRTRDEIHALGLQMEALRDENAQLVEQLSGHAELEIRASELQRERDEALEIRDDLLSAAAYDEGASAMPPSPSAPSHGGYPDRGNPNERLNEKLREGKWRFERKDGGHNVYKRVVVYETESETKEQTFTTPSTPSDRRSLLNALSDLRAQDNGVMDAFEKEAGSGQHARMVRLKEANRKRKELKEQLEMQETEIAIIESEFDL